jgi:hypothetical protein
MQNIMRFIDDTKLSSHINLLLSIIMDLFFLWFDNVVVVVQLLKAMLSRLVCGRGIWI